MSPGRGCGGRSPPAPAGATGSTHSTAAMQAAIRIAFISRPPVGWGEHIRRSGACQIREELARSEEHTSELQSLMRNSYAVFCLKKKKTRKRSQTALTSESEYE